MKVKIIPSDGNNAQTSSPGNTAQNNVQSQLEKSENEKIQGWEYFRWKKRFCSVYGIIWPQIWPWILSACVHELVRSEKERSFVFNISKKHMLLHSFWNVKRIYSEWRRLLLTSCICTVQPVWEMRIVHLNWTQICKCTSTGFISMKNFFWKKYCIKKSTST